MSVNDVISSGSQDSVSRDPIERGRVAVVTGAASGIGQGLFERFAAEGMHVVMADVEEPALSKAAELWRSRAGIGGYGGGRSPGRQQHGDFDFGLPV
jgi:NAD(P)-dependent dehydrogenase (short-subunit alcohol dehydrogenase family)